MYRWRRTLQPVLVCLALFSTAAFASWQATLPKAQMLGSGEFKLWGLHIYTARLWGDASGFVATQPFALEIIYHRSISRERLVDTSLDEIRRLSGQAVTQQQLDQWQEQMRQAFVDVDAGVRITGVYMPGQGCRFYVGERLQHEVRDDAFARAFFAIWLDPRTRNPELRHNLLGASS